MKTLILGMGNPILGDDGVGIHIVKALEKIFPDFDIITLPLIDLQLLEIIAGYDRLFIVDALAGNSNDIGTVKRVEREKATMHLFSSHGIHFIELYKLGIELNYRLPEIRCIYGIAIGRECSFGTSLSPEIMAKRESIIRRIVSDIKKTDF